MRVFCLRACALATAGMTGWCFGALGGNFRAPAEEAREAVPGFLWLEAEGFADYGNWKLDTQFTHKMGSAYLLAAGALRPVRTARTSVDVPRAGAWTAWVRTKDWVPEHHPGRFRLTLDGKGGRELGASGRPGWTWEKAGVWQLAAGRAAVALEDLSGAFARCDAVLLTTDAAYVPPEEGEALAAERLRLTGADPTVRDGGGFDVVVVGAGSGGMGAALSAARHGARVALVHDRPVLGGNASMELGVPLDGAAVAHPFTREGGICEEAELRRRLRTDGGNSQLLSGVFDEMCAELPNLTVFANERVLAVEKRGERIARVVSRNAVTGRRTRFGGTVFVDATGDGWIGHFAGAKMMYGREAKAEYDEWPAPDRRDELTMSGCLMACSCLGYEHRKTGRPVPFETPAWADVLPKDFTRKHVFNADSQWWTEHAGRFDDCADPEGARDQLVRINLAYWGWLKNRWQERASIADEELVTVAYMNGRREGMRIVGDYVLTANDCLQGRVFPDRVAYGGWPLDTHDPLGMENPNDDTWGYWKHHPGVPVYTIPFRCLYSASVPNLMMAGRDISATHIALGSTRVQATCLTLGQAVGTAAAEMVRRGLEPRVYGERHVAELQQLLLKDDQYIPQVANEDSNDLVRQATVAATSFLASETVAVGHPTLAVDARAVVPLDRPRATLFRRGNLSSLGAFRCHLRAFAGCLPAVTVVVYTASSPSGKASDRHKVGCVVSRTFQHWPNWARFVPEKPIRLNEPYVWVQLLPVRDVTWSRCDRLVGVGARMAEGDGDWKLTGSAALAFCPEDGFRVPIDARAEKVADGVSRPVGDEWHGWVSDPRAGLPQTLSVSFDKPHEVAEVRLTFDSHLEKMHPDGMPMPPRLVRDYVLEGFDGTAWLALATVRDNDRRLRAHRFPAQTLAGFRVRVDATWGDASARIFEVRAYGPEGAVGSAGRVAVDFSATCGKVKPVNGVGQPPMVGMPVEARMFHYLKEAGIPYSRLHDVGGWQGQHRYVDIPNVFPDFDADENDPKNYAFDCTDVLLKNLVANGVEPFYRLGVSIENPWEWGLKIGTTERIVPPKDFEKWARICEHVIRHYTEGWANGFHYTMTRWEIWNEPDNRQDPSISPLWQAPFEEYIRFYGVVAPYLKAKFPHLKIGGFGCCGFYAGVGCERVAAAHADTRVTHHLACAKAFLKAVKANGWPLDFFSYHSYSDAGWALKQVDYADRLLDSYGFTRDRTERVFNEWLPAVSHENLGSPLQAAQIAAELIGLQNGPCDVACIYDGRCGIGNYSPLFNPMTYRPHKAYYSFLAFNELRKLGTAVKPPATPEGVYAAAATDGKGRAALLVANISGKTWAPVFDFGAWTVRRVRTIDAANDYGTASAALPLSADSVRLYELSK